MPKQPEPRLRPERDDPLLSRLEPKPNELFRSFLARTARACEMPYYTLLERLGVAIKNTTPPWVGVHLTNEESELIAPILRHDTPTLQALQLPIHQSPNPHRVKHPTRYRACAECQTEHGAWMRWNADPIHIVCPIHQTLLHSEGPAHEPLRNDKPFTHEIDWTSTEQNNRSDLDDHAVLQELLRHHRLQNPKIDKMFARVLIAYQRAAKHSPDSLQLEFVTEIGRATLDKCRRATGIEQQRARVTDTQTIWASVEDTVAIFPAATVFILEAIVEDNRRGYNELLEDLRDLAPPKPINTSSVDLDSSTMVLHGLPSFDDSDGITAYGPSEVYQLDRYYEKWLWQARVHRLDRATALAA